MSIHPMQAALQKELDLISSALLDGRFSLVRPRLLIWEADTAATDARAWVRLPPEFLGIGLDEDRPDIFTGLLAHEVGHWLQPVKAIQAVEKETGLRHDILNTLLDAHGEALIVRVFSLFGNPLKAVRALVGRKMEVEYRGALKAAQSLEDAAAPLLLICRYCLLPDVSFARAKFNPHQKKAQGSILERLEELMGRVQEVLSLEPCLLPDWIRDFVKDFPELCQPAASLPEDPLGSVLGGGEGMDVIQAALASLKVDDAPAPAIVEYRPSGRSAPTPEVAALGRQLTVRWLTSKTANISIAAPGKFNRLSALRGDPVPYYAQLQRSASGKQDALQALLAVDWSGSMSGPKWLAARAAAQAITLALRANGGEVHALLFAEGAWHAPDYSADVLFHDRLGVIDLTNANGEDTSFRWLPQVWERFPTHRVLVLTDGNGNLPNLVLPSWRKRTSVILLMVRDEAGSHTEYVEQIETTVSTFASQLVHVSSLDELASAWAYLIPRRWNA